MCVCEEGVCDDWRALTATSAWPPHHSDRFNLRNKAAVQAKGVCVRRGVW